jgi:hypothetical protein
MMKITYRSKDYFLSSDAGSIRTWPKAAVMVLYFRIASESAEVPDGLAEIIHSEVGKFLGSSGQINEKGLRVFAQDKEVLTAAERHRYRPKDPEAPPETAEETPGDTALPPLKSGSVGQPPSSPQPGPAAETSGANTITNIKPEALKVESSQRELADLLDLIQQFLARFVIFADAAHATVVALWIAHTWVLDSFRFTPYLFISSATKRCGKSRLLECLTALVCRPWSIVSATEATVMRQIDAEKPTLLFDEVDAVYRSSRDRSKEGLRALLNCGFARGAKVPRCAGREIIHFDVFCPKALAGIRDCIPTTVKDRSIHIKLIRRGKGQFVEKLRYRDVEDATTQIVEGLKNWAGDETVISQLNTSRPDVPREFNDRAADITEPLIAIADLAGGGWPMAARDALVALLRTNDGEEADEPDVRLLSAIRDIFLRDGKRHMSTYQILRLLAAREEEEEWTSRWPRQINAGNTRGPAAKMASLLRPHGIKAGSIRLPDGSTPKGYSLADFTDAFERYLPHLPDIVATTPQQPAFENGETVNRGETKPTSLDRHCGDVATVPNNAYQNS